MKLINETKINGHESLNHSRGHAHSFLQIRDGKTVIHRADGTASTTPRRCSCRKC